MTCTKSSQATPSGTVIQAFGFFPDYDKHFVVLFGSLGSWLFLLEKGREGVFLFGTIPSQDHADCDANLQLRRRQGDAFQFPSPLSRRFQLCIVNACQTQTWPKTNSKQKPKRFSWPQSTPHPSPLNTHPFNHLSSQSACLKKIYAWVLFGWEAHASFSLAQRHAPKNATPTRGTWVKNSSRGNRHLNAFLENAN